MMYYFSKVHAQSAQNYETTFYIVFDADNTDHNLTKEILADNNQYKDFAEKKENSWRPAFWWAFWPTPRRCGWDAIGERRCMSCASRRTAIARTAS